MHCRNFEAPNPRNDKPKNNYLEMAQLPFGSVQEWFDAVKRRDYDSVVFNLPVYQTTTDSNGETALMYAVRNMDAEMTLLLGPLECGAVNNIGYSALMLAAERNFMPGVESLLYYEKDLRLPDGRNALILAAQHNALDAIYLLRQELWGQTDLKGRSALTYAAANGYIDSVKLLVQNTYKELAPDIDQAIVHASSRRHDGVVQYLSKFSKALQLRSSVTSTMNPSSTTADFGYGSGTSLLNSTLRDGGNSPLQSSKAFSPASTGLANTFSGGASIRNTQLTKQFQSSTKYDGLLASETIQPLEIQNRQTPSHSATSLRARNNNKPLSIVDNNTIRLPQPVHAPSHQMTTVNPAYLYNEIDVTDLMTASSPSTLPSHEATGTVDKSADISSIVKGTSTIALTGTSKKENRSDWSPLMTAADSNQFKLVQQLIPLHAGKETKDGLTALMIAAKKNHSQIVSALVEREGGMKMTNTLITALMFAAQHNSLASIKFLVPRESGMRDSNGRTAMMFAAQNGHAKVVQQLLKLEGKLCDQRGWTAMMYAAQNGHLSVVKLLAKSEMGVQENDGGTALMLAAEEGHADIIPLLVKTEGTLRDKSGATALMVAASGGHVAIVKSLLQTEGGMKNNEGYTALMGSAYSGHLGCVQALIPREAGLTMDDGWTALMSASQNGHLTVVEQLLEREAGRQTNTGWTALMSAAHAGYASICRVLGPMENGFRDNHGKSALNYASEGGHSDVVAILRKM
ncbi:Protein 21.1 [Giardia lamblia P15]|uniref:Protein 21.1 n=1 Tax=Giardia intestinalis (strain P15) TaxID=658858 RepID=E1F6C2_GIAIA|nr:Protein 21.1 [Giardia lamblia P15]